MLLGTGAQILGGDIHDAVGVDIEGDLDLRHATAGGSDAVQMEAAQGLVGSSHFTLALKDVDLHRGLVIRSSGEDLALLHRDGSVAVDQLGAHAAHGLNAQGQGGDVQQQQALHVAGEHAALQGCTHSHALVGVDALEAFFAGELLDHVLHGGDTAGAAHHQDLVDVIAGEASVTQSLTDGAGGSLHQMSGQLVELSPGQGQIQMLGAGGVRSDIGQVDVGGGHAGQLDLGLLSSLLQALHGNLVAGEVHIVGALELADHPLHNALIEVIAAQTVVACGGQNLDNAVINVQNGHVEGTAAQVIDHDLLGLLLIHTVGKSGCGRLVDDTLHVQTGDLAGVLGGLTLGVGKVSGNGDDSLRNGLAQIGLSVALELLQDHGADLLRGVGLAVHVHLVIAAHFTLDGRNGAVGVGDGLTLCHLAHHTLAGLAECHHRRGGAVALGVGDDNGFAALHDSHAAICCT